jgi:hypothetical protein
VVSDGDVHDAAAVVRHDHEHEQKPARRRRDDEEVSGGNLLGVVRQEGAPRLQWRRGRSRHVLRDGCLRDVDTELQELAFDPIGTKSGQSGERT